MDIIKWALIGISIAILVGPVCGALLMYRNNLEALVVPKIPEFMTNIPEIEFVRYQAVNHTLRIKIVNPYSTELTFSSISGEVFCSDHNVQLGNANWSGSVSIPAKSHGFIDLTIDYTSQGSLHIFTVHLFSMSVNVDLRNLALNVQGIKLRYKEPINIGAISTS